MNSINRNHMGFVCFILLSLFFVTSFSYAKSYDSLYRGIRPIGMGGAFTAVADDHNALYYNPAGLSKIKTLNFAVLNPTAAMSASAFELTDYNIDDFEDWEFVSDFLTDNIGEDFYASGGFYPYLGMNFKKKVGFMVAGFYEVDASAIPHDLVNPYAEVNAVIDYGINVGAGMYMPFLKGLSAGISLKYIYRHSIQEDFDYMEIAKIADEGIDYFLDEYENTGAGVSADFGVMYEHSLKWFDLSYAVAGQNIPNMDMGDAKDINSQFNLGFALKKKLGNFDFVFALDYNDMFNNYDEDSDYMKRLHTGIEFKFPKILALRTGLNQGYFTFGGTVDLTRIVRIEFATYGEESGAYAGQREDRRYMAMLSFGYH